MTNWLVKIFVKDYNDITNESVREKYGILSSIVGIICNITLFVLKYILGTMSNSIAIISDGFNNLSDSASCIITLFGYKMAAKPADKDHPFGHGRIEYLTSLLVAVLIIFVGFELLRNSVDKLLHPIQVQFSWTVLISLIISIGVKIWMALFNRVIGNRIHSLVMLATSQDSRNDVVVTTATIIALTSALFTDVPVDGIMGIFVSVFILYSGYKIIKGTVDILLGQPADPELVEELKILILSNEHILGLHDLIIHSYGPGKQIGSGHVEVSADENIVEIHEAIDQVEKEVYEKLKLILTLHMDPIEQDNVFTDGCRELVEDIIHNIHESLSVHDFRVVFGSIQINLIFDISVPYECEYSNEEIKNSIDQQLKVQKGSCNTIITFDRSFYS